MGEVGQVIENKGEEVIVKLKRTEACAKCKACTVGFESKDMFIEAKNICNANTNDFVNLELKTSSFLSAILIMYFIPFLFMIVGFFLGYYTIGNLFSENLRELSGFLTGIILMLVSYLIIKLNNKKFSKEKFEPTATHIVNKGVEGNVRKS